MITPEDLAKLNTEDGHQAALFCQMALNFDKYPMLRWAHSIPNGGSRHLSEAVKLKATGLKAGVWDIFLPCPRLKPSHVKYDGFEMWYHGLYIEMKVLKRANEKNGGLTDEQIKFMTYAVVAGYKCVVAYSWQQAWDEIVNYLKGG